MSGSHEVPAVHLLGPGMAALVQAIPIAARATGRPVVVVGGLAVLCRLSRPYRATTDLDTVSGLEEGQTGQLELLVAAGATLSGPSGVQLPTALGPVQVDVLQVADADFDPLPDDPTDRLHVLSHAWAADTATLMTLMADAPPPVDVLVAQPAALVAMKLQSAMNRGPPRKERTSWTSSDSARIRSPTDRLSMACSRQDSSSRTTPFCTWGDGSRRDVIAR